MNEHAVEIFDKMSFDQLFFFSGIEENKLFCMPNLKFGSLNRKF